MLHPTKASNHFVFFFLAALFLVVGCGPSTKAFKGRDMKMGYCFDAAFHEPSHRLLVCAGPVGLHLFQIRQGEFHYLSTLLKGGYCRNIKIAGDKAFVADTRRGLVVLDLSTANPEIRWAQGRGGAMGLDIAGDRLLVAVGNKGLQVWSIAEPGPPRLVGQCRTSGEAWDVWSKDDHAFVADLKQGVTVVSLGDPKKPAVVGRALWDNDTSIAEIIRGENDTVCVAAGAQGLILLDVSTPRRPKVVGRYHTQTPLACAEGLSIRNGIVYLANARERSLEENGLIVLDVRDPSAPRVLGECNFLGWVEGVCVAGRYAFVTSTSSGVRLIDISDPAQPRLVDSFGPILEPLADDLLREPIRQEEKRILAEYQQGLAQIKRGQRIEDLSRPWRALLTLLTAERTGDLDLYGKVNPSNLAYMERVAAKGESWARADYEIHLRRVRVLTRPPQEGDVCPLYVGDRGDSEITDIEVFAYLQGNWRKLFNMGRAEADWRRGVPKALKKARQLLNSRSGQKQ